MKNIDLLPLTPEAKKRLIDFARMYKQNAHIFIEIISFDGTRLIVRAEQKELTNTLTLSKKELEKRVRDMFTGEIPEQWKLTISAANFDRNDIEQVDIAWINSNMERLSLKQKHIINYTGIDKSTISTLLSGNRELTKWQKATFYYMFKYIEFSTSVFKN